MCVSILMCVYITLDFFFLSFPPPPYSSALYNFNYMMGPTLIRVKFCVIYIRGGCLFF